MNHFSVTRRASHFQSSGRPAPVRVGVLLGPALCVLLGTLLTGAGCAKPLLTPNEERSQYDRYDAIRGQRSSAYTYDEFGTRRPNLRGRLLYKE